MPLGNVFQGFSLQVCSKCTAKHRWMLRFRCGRLVLQLIPVFFQVFIILGGANLHTPCIDDSAGRSRQKRFGINIIYHFLLRLQTANYHLHVVVCRNSRCLRGISACPWWVCLLLLLVPWQRWSRNPLSDLLVFSRGEGGNGLHNQHTCLFETLKSVSERQLLARCQLLAKLQHICLSSSDL